MAEVAVDLPQYADIKAFKIQCLHVDVVNDALVGKRRSRICPLELANKNVFRWKVDKDVWYVWTAGKERGYAISETPEGITVLTTLVGQETEVAKRKLRRAR